MTRAAPTAAERPCSRRRCGLDETAPEEPMAETYDLIIRGGVPATPNGIAPADIAVRGGRIAAIGRVAGTAGEELDAKGLHVLPGVIDTQVHFREPGLEHKEDLGTGTAAAA